MVTPTWLLRRFTMSCEVYLREPDPVPDEYGNVVYDTTLWGTTMCFLQPYTQVELQDGRAEVGAFLLTLPAECDGVVNAFSSFVVDGVPYEAVEMAAGPHSLISFGVHHVELTVQRSSA